MKNSIAVLLLISLLHFPLPAEATFPGKAIVFWDASISNEVNDPEYQQVLDLAREKNYAKAMAIIEKKILAMPKEGTPLYLKALLLNEMGIYAEALSFARKGSALQPRHPAVYFANCQIYRNLGEAESSDRGCKIAADQHPEAPEAHYEAAQVLMLTGNMTEATKELDLATKLNSTNVRYPFERGMAYFYLNKYDEAEKSFLQALSIDPDDMEANYQLGYLYAAKKKKDKALPYIQRILKSGKTHPNVQSAEALMDHLNKGTLDKLTLKTDHKTYHTNRAQAFYKAGKYGPALIEIQTSARLNPKDLKIQQILVGMLSTLMRLNQTEDAVKHLLELAKGNTLIEGSGQQELGDIYVLRGDFKEAKTHYEKARELGDPNEIAKISLSEFPKDTSIPAWQLNQDEIFIQPTEALNRKGEVFAHYGMYERSIAIYGMVLQMDPNHLMGKLNTATAYYQTKKYGPAISILEKTLISNPNHEQILAHRLLLAQAYARKGDLEGSIKNLEASIKLNPGIKKIIESDPAFESLRNKDSYKNLFH